MRARLALLALSLAVPLGASAQHATVHGRVVDDETGAPLPGAHVIVAGTMLGTAAGPDGHYRLGRVPAGAHRLYASMLGYEPAAVDTLLRAGPYAIDLRMAPTVVEVGRITVEAARDPRWQRRLRRFERLFLGESSNADSVRLLNPEVLSFEAGWGRLEATAAAPLEIETRALGYHVTYYLEDFRYAGTTLRYDGEPLFAPLAPRDSAEAARWAVNRQRAYYGSFRHYLLALLAGTTEAQGFRTYRRLHLDRSDTRFYADPARLLRDGPSPTEKLFRFNGYLEVIYFEEAEEEAFLRWQGRYGRTAAAQRSFLRLTDGPTLVDHTGEVIDPYGVTVYGYFAFERLADLLPKEFVPEEPGN